MKEGNGLVKWISLSRLEILLTGEVSLPRTIVHLAAHPGIIVEHRGDDTIKLFSYMDKLRDQALAAGGMILSHLGNHEWMNVIGMSSETCTRPTTLQVVLPQVTGGMLVPAHMCGLISTQIRVSIGNRDIRFRRSKRKDDNNRSNR